MEKFQELHDDEYPLQWDNFNFNGWKKYCFHRWGVGEEAIEVSYENHAEFHENNWIINWEGEAHKEGEGEEELC
eukprot:4907128-Prymnesium_polylepis.1